MAGGAVGPGRPVGLGPIEQDLTRPTVRTGSGFGLARGPLPICAFTRGEPVQWDLRHTQSCRSSPGVKAWAACGAPD